MIPGEEAKFAVELLLLCLFGIVMVGGAMIWLYFKLKRNPD